LNTPITITKIIVSILEFKAQYITHNMGSIVEPSSIQTDYRQKRNFPFTRNNNGKAFLVAHYLSFYIYTKRWRFYDVNYNDLLFYN
jgi:hypothetical protein